MTILKVGSLFAGVGGICLGFQQAKYKNSGYQIQWANELDSYACETYRQNFSHPILEGDINKVLHPINDEFKDLHEQMFSEPIDVLNGGFPCQAFSISGLRKGFEDEKGRGRLFEAFIDFINIHNEKFHKKPRFLFLENVRYLLTHDKGNTFNTIKSKLEACGYKVKANILNTMELTNLPQNRERLYIIGFLNQDDEDRFNFFDKEKLDLLIKKNLKKINRLEQIQKVIDFSESNPYFFYTPEKYPRYFNKIDNNQNSGLIDLSKEITEENQFYQIRRGMYVRRNKKSVCPTLTANMGTGGHNVPLIKIGNTIRKLTPTEVFKLQGFPIGHGYHLPKQYQNRPFPLWQLYKEANNSVSVPIIKLLAKELLKLL